MDELTLFLEAEQGVKNLIQLNNIELNRSQIENAPIFHSFLILDVKSNTGKVCRNYS